MIVHYGDIFGCEVFQNGQQFFLAAPQGTDPDLLIANGFVQMSDGSWHHYLNAQESQYIQSHQNFPELRLQSVVTTKEETTEEKQGAILLCFITLGLAGMSMLLSLVSAILADEPEWIRDMLWGGSGLCFLGSFATMIATRVRYPRNTFGKVLMWCFIGLFILQVLLFIAVAIACGIGMAACFNDLQNCPG